MSRAIPLCLLAMCAAHPVQAAALTVCTEAAPEIFNPQLSNNGSTIFVLNQIYDGLLSVERGGDQIQPALAESWTVSEDGLVYTFKLRQDVAWQSNTAFTPTRPLNADDVLFTFDRMMDEGHPYHTVGGGSYPTYDGKLSQVLSKVEKLDDDTVAFTLKEPYSPFLGVMTHGSLGITSAEYAQTLETAGEQTQFDLAPVGTGPFQFQAYQLDSMVRLLPFADTWGAKIGDQERTPLVDAVLIGISTDASVRLQRALAGECLIGLYPNLDDRDQIEASENLVAVRTPVASTGWLRYNFGDGKLQDRRVRQALSQAINVDDLVDVVYSGLAEATSSPTPRAMWGHADHLEPRPYDPEGAKALLAEAGYPDGFEVELWAVPVARPYMPNGRRAAEIIQADWAAIGVKAEIVTFEWAEYIDRVRAGEAQTALFGGIYDFPDPSQIPTNGLTCTPEGKPGSNNIGRWCNEQYNALMTEAERITDQTERARIYAEAASIFHDEVVAVVLGSADTITAVAKSVQGFKPAIFGASRLAGVSVE